VQDIWRAYRSKYQNEPFVRLVRDRKGLYQLPDPKVVAGSNFCDIGFELDTHCERLVLFSAIDNLMKGASGQAVQCLNIMIGTDERTALESSGFHPM
jgi:N-acetyl-gamma-glutamyl-phosphate/LysW-gamma-L-alpha-aminoadipyl-6-phosphate reductase